MNRMIHLRSIVCSFLLLVLLLPAAGKLYGVDEQSLPEMLESEILPNYEQNFKSGFISGFDNVPIYYAKKELVEAKGAIIVLPGRKEYALKYAEFFYDIKDWGYSVYVMDHRGQGKSGRLLSDSVKGHVNRFEDYIADFHLFLNEVVNKVPHKKRFVVAHSMGALIALQYAMEHPKALDGMVLCSPMLQINLSSQPAFLTIFTAVLMDSIWLGDVAVPFPELFAPDFPFEKNRVTHSQTRYKMNSMLLEKHKDQFVGPPTFRWLRQGLNTTKTLRNQAKQLRTPTLILQAEQDKVVTAEGQNEYCSQSEACQIKIISQAYHEILMEKDELRNLAMNAIVDFLESHTL